MNPIVEGLRTKLEARDIAGFLADFREHVAAVYGQPELTFLTQSTLPPVLLGMLKSRLVAGPELIELWQLIRNGRLLVLDGDIREAINEQIDGAFREVRGSGHPPVEKFWLPQVEPAPGRPAPPQQQSRVKGVTMPGHVTLTERVVIASTFSVGLVHVTDSFDCRKNVCASSQEREFLKAVRQYLPNLHAYPNVPLQNFVDIDRLTGQMSERMRAYVRASQVDVLLCTDDEDPVGAIELDSVLHDSPEASERDELKNEFFSIAGLPLVRIRAANTTNVRAEDFYDLLTTNSTSIQELRPRRLRPRRNHDFLVPAESAYKVTAERH